MRHHLQALRPHQWVKNLLVFAPLIAEHETSLGSYLTAAVMCVALSACASSAYLLNDLLDLPHDRAHANKRRRPLAAGLVEPRAALVLSAILAVGGLALAFLTSRPGGVCVLLYVVLTLAYSLLLKRRLLVDVLTLAALYMVRIFVGSVTLSITLSPWFLAFFLFAFTSLAITKRQNELQKLPASGDGSIDGRAWCAGDRPALAALGGATAIGSVLVLALYIQSPEVDVLYGRPEFLWLLCPLLIYWMGRMMLLANRGAVDDDPVEFILRDRVCQLTALAMAAAFAAAL